MLLVLHLWHSLSKNCCFSDFWPSYSKKTVATTEIFGTVKAKTVAATPIFGPVSATKLLLLLIFFGTTQIFGPVAEKKTAATVDFFLARLKQKQLLLLRFLIQFRLRETGLNQLHFKLFGFSSKSTETSPNFIEIQGFELRSFWFNCREFGLAQFEFGRLRSKIDVAETSWSQSNFGLFVKE